VVAAADPSSVTHVPGFEIKDAVGLLENRSSLRSTTSHRKLALSGDAALGKEKLRCGFRAAFALSAIEGDAGDVRENCWMIV